MPLYKHTQIGYMVIIPLIITLVVAGALPHSTMPFIVLPLVVLGLILIIVLFASLTVEVTEEHLKFWFGIGIIHKRVCISDIESCKRTRTFLPGWGIDLTRRGWRYNVSGFNLVEITLKNGKRFLLGTDEVEDLTSALTKALLRSTKNIQHRVRQS